MNIYRTYSSEETKKVGSDLAKKIANRKSQIAKIRGAVVLALKGDLGSGKTTFVQGFLKELGIRGKAQSPTFVIFKKYKVKRNNEFKDVYHFDCYRIKKAGELKILGIKEILENPKNIVLIEWPEQIKKILPKNIWKIEFKHGKKENERVFKISK
jgi:tRNA threonylcarbamoyladenosine biosynthesis protein TsaE